MDMFAILLGQSLSLSSIEAGIEEMESGIIVMFCGSSAPSGWRLCDGSTVLRSSDLGQVLVSAGLPFGTGDGSTTVNIPDFRGRVSLGAGQGSGLTNRFLGNTLGEESHTLSLSEMPSHGMHGAAQYGMDGGPYQAIQPSGSTDRGSDSAHNNMSPSLVVNFIIKD